MGRLNPSFGGFYAGGSSIILVEEGGEPFDRSLVSSQPGDKEVIRCWRGSLIALLLLFSFSSFSSSSSSSRFNLRLLRE